MPRDEQVPSLAGQSQFVGQDDRDVLGFSHAGALFAIVQPIARPRQIAEFRMSRQQHVQSPRGNLPLDQPRCLHLPAAQILAARSRGHARFSQLETRVYE